jgi:hypothetical protein
MLALPHYPEADLLERTHSRCNLQAPKKDLAGLQTSALMPRQGASGQPSHAAGRTASFNPAT